jgi:hypothetical protein
VSEPSPIGYKILRWVVRESESHPAGSGGWVAYGIPYSSDPAIPFEESAMWEWDDYLPLVADGLLDRSEDWKNVYVRLTDAGWRALSRSRSAA